MSSFHRSALPFPLALLWPPPLKPQGGEDEDFLMISSFREEDWKEGLPLLVMFFPKNSYQCSLLLLN